MSAECDACGLTAADLPYEELCMTLEEASEFMFDHDNGAVICKGCAQ